MSARSLGLLMWAAAVVVIAAAIAATRETAMPAEERTVPAVVAAAPGSLLTDTRSNAILAGSRPDPFSRTWVRDRPGEVETAEEVVVLPVSDPLDELRVAGIIGGPPWHALVFAGPSMGRSIVVTAGDSIASGLVLDVGPDSVRIAGPARTHVLTVRSRR